MIRSRSFARFALASAFATSLAACPSPAPEGEEDGEGGGATTSSSGTPSGPASTSSTPASSSSTASQGNGGGGGSPSTSQGNGGDPAGTGGDPTGTGGAAEGSGGTTSPGSGGAGGDDCPGDEDRCEDGCKNLTNDEENCGECGHSCLGGECAGSECQPLELYAGTYAGSIALDATQVWFIEEGGSNGYVMRIAKTPDPGEDAEQYEMVSSYTFALALTTTHAVWADYSGDTSTKRLLEDGSDSEELTEDACLNPRAAVADGTDVFLACEGSSTAGTRRVLRVDVGSGDAERLPADATGGPSAIALDDTWVYFVDNEQFGGDNMGVIARWRRDGSGSYEPLTDPISGVFDLAVYDGRVYFAVAGAPGVQVVDAAPESSPETIFDDDATRIAVDASGVYWFDSGGGKLRTSRHDGDDVRELADATDIRDIALDDDAIYWSTGDEGRVWKLAK